MAISQKKAIEIIDRWKRDMTPRYRGFVCGNCGKQNMKKAWHIHVDQPPYKRELHLCRNCGKQYGLEEKTLIIVTTNNGQESLDRLLPTLEGLNYIIYDTSIEGGYQNKAISAYKRYPEYDSFFFMHDSMLIKDKNFLDFFREKDSDVVGWLRFPLFFDNQEQRDWLSYMGIDTYPEYGIFGPIFYATKDALDKLEAQDLFLPPCENKNQMCASERGWAMAFDKAGVKVEFVDNWDNDRVINDGYPYLTKYFLHRT